MSRIPRTLWVLLIAGLLLRVAALSFRPLYALSNAPDEREFYLLSHNLAHGEGFALEGQPVAYRAVFFSAFAAPFLRALGPSPRPVLVAQAVLSTLTGLLVFSLAAHRFGRWAAIYAAGAWLLMPSAILYTAFLLPHTLFIFLWVLTLVLYDRLERYGFRLRDSLLLGLVMGTVTLTREIGLLFFLGLFLYLLVIRSEPWLHTHWRAAVVMAAGCLLVILPWMARNAQAVGVFSLSTSGGINLLLRPSTNLSVDQTPLRQADQVPAARALEPRADSVSDPQVALRRPEIPADDSTFARPQLLSTTALWGRKLVRLWAMNVRLWTRYLTRDDPAQTVARVRAAPLMLLLLASLPSLLLFGTGSAGLALQRRFRNRGLYLLLIGIMLLATFVAFGLPRDQLPFLPLMLVGLAAFLHRPPWYRIPVTRRVFVLGLVSGLVVLWVAGGMAVALL